MPPIRNQALAPFSAKATLVVEQKLGDGGGGRARKELQFKRLTEAEIMEKRAKGLCYRCNEKFLGHRCKQHESQVLMVLDDEEREEQAATRDQRLLK